MAFPLLVRLEIDRASKPNLFLANSEYEVDFVSMRDCTTPAGGLWTFKTVEDDDPYLLSSVRTCLGPHLTHVFGQVDAVKQTNVGFVVRLRCPDDVSCLTRHMYALQVARLQETLDGEQAFVGGEIVSSWFFTPAQGMPCPPTASCFYVRVSSRMANSTFAAGALIEMVVSLRQLQNDDAGVVRQAYSLAAHKFWILADDDVPRMEPGYRCDLSVLGNECVDCVEYVS